MVLGAGEPVLLLHGGIGSTRDWARVATALVDAGFQAIAVDCRGRGRSTWGDLPITYTLMASDALGVLDHLEIERTNVVGKSDGGILCLELAINSPDRLIKAVPCAANFTSDGVLNPETVSPTLDTLFSILYEDYVSQSPEPDRFDEMLGELNALYAVAPNYTEEQLGGITTPVLIISGDHDEFVKADQPFRLAELIPDAQLAILPDTGHAVPYERPDEFNRLVLNFLMA